uniref:Uncharacterized protein n=1 Tax=Aegilops tauschii subsp. strangulata TaxID=200361 RepID=A0A453NH08_AEGTS
MNRKEIAYAAAQELRTFSCEKRRDVTPTSSSLGVVTIFFFHDPPCSCSHNQQIDLPISKRTTSRRIDIPADIAAEVPAVSNLVGRATRH